MLTRRLFWLLIPVSLVLFACSETAQPRADHEIRVETARFFPSVEDVALGASVRWTNVLRDAPENVRTVTSGTGPDDPEAGALFDVSLKGFASGEATGESFLFSFSERGTYSYFSRLPDGAEFTGTIRVQ